MSYESPQFQVDYQTPPKQRQHLLVPKCERDIMHMYAETHALQQQIQKLGSLTACARSLESRSLKRAYCDIRSFLSLLYSP